VQTAELAADVFKMKRQAETSDALLPGSGSADVITELLARDEDAVVLFGHNPHLSRLVSDMISRGAADIQLKKASVTALDFEGAPGEGMGILKWMLTPGLLGL